MKKANKGGRPRKSNPPTITTANGLNPQNPIKRGRGRPRKYPTVVADSEPRNPPPPAPAPPRLVFRCPSADLLELSKSPGQPLSWGYVPRGKRLQSARRTARGSPPSAAESSSDSGPVSGPDPEPGCSPESELSWYAGIEIPGPIPDLDELMRDQSIFRAQDFFADVPEHWGWFN